MLAGFFLGDGFAGIIFPGTAGFLVFAILPGMLIFATAFASIIIFDIAAIVLTVTFITVVTLILITLVMPRSVISGRLGAIGFLGLARWLGKGGAREKNHGER
jgi:hypothetical protein